MKKLLLSLGLVALVGCTTLGLSKSFETTAGKFLTTTAATVDAAMKGWAAWAVVGKTTTADDNVVRDIYGKYQSAMMIATNAYVLAVKTGDSTIFAGPSNNLFVVKEKLTSATVQAAH
jgi:hypothetical protein